MFFVYTKKYRAFKHQLFRSSNQPQPTSSLLLWWDRQGRLWAAELGAALWARRDQGDQTSGDQPRASQCWCFNGHEKNWLVGQGHPSEKYESQLGWLFLIYGKIENVPNHQSENVSIWPIYCWSMLVVSVPFLLKPSTQSLFKNFTFLVFCWSDWSFELNKLPTESVQNSFRVTIPEASARCWDTCKCLAQCIAMRGVGKAWQGIENPSEMPVSSIRDII